MIIDDIYIALYTKMLIVFLRAYTNQCIITPAMPGYPAHGALMANGEQGINSCRYPFTTPGLREIIVDKMPCLGAYALSETRTRDPLITSREHEPIYYSAST